VPKYKSNLNIFFKGGYLEDNILPLIIDIPNEITVEDVDAWEVLIEDLDNKVGFFKSFDPQVDFYLLLENKKYGVVFYGNDWKLDCVRYMQDNNLQHLIALLGWEND
jgi:serine/threonine-protein kinase RIO1